MAKNFKSWVMFSKPWLGIALLLVKEDKYSEVCTSSFIKVSLFLKGTMLSAFSFPISVLHRSEMVCKTVLNSKSCNVLSVIDIMLSWSMLQSYKG